jgi:DNA polymerase III delta subunit
MSQQEISKDVLNKVKKATGKKLSEQSLKKIASGVNQKTIKDGAELRKLIDKVSNLVNIPVSNETANEIIKSVKKTGNTEQLENMMKKMMNK